MTIEEKIEKGLAYDIGSEILEPLGSLVVVRQKVRDLSIKDKAGNEIKLALPEEAIKGGSLEVFEGEVLCVGPSVTKVSAGDYVEFGRNTISTKTQESNGKEYLYLYESSVCCKRYKKESI